MTLAEKVAQLCEEHGITRNKFEVESGVGRGQTARWDKNRPSVDKLQLAANYFGVDVSFFTLPDVYVPPEKHIKTATVTEGGLQRLADDERVLLEHYRSMTENDREMMRDLARRLKHGD